MANEAIRAASSSFTDVSLDPVATCLPSREKLAHRTELLCVVTKRVLYCGDARVDDVASSSSDLLASECAVPVVIGTGAPAREADEDEDEDDGAEENGTRLGLGLGLEVEVEVGLLRLELGLDTVPLGLVKALCTI